MAGTHGLVCTLSGGPRASRIQRPAARTRSGGSGDEHSGRSRRWRRPWRGSIGAATAYPPACRSGARRYHRFPRAQPAAGRRQALRPAARADRHAVQPGSRDRPIAGRGRSIHPQHRDRPGCHTGRGTPGPAPGTERTATCGAHQRPSTSHPAAGSATATRSEQAHWHPTRQPPRSKDHWHEPRRFPAATSGPQCPHHPHDHREHAVARR